MGDDRGMKYFTVSFDDGLEQDKRIIQLMNQYGIKGTFNLNAGVFGLQGYIKRIGNIGFQDTEVRKKFLLWDGVEHYRIPEDEIAQVYAGQEIASHGYMHENMRKLGYEKAKESISRDIEKLTEISGYEIMGFAYPFGMTSPAIKKALQELGIVYARLVGNSHRFTVGADPLSYVPTTAITDKKLDQILDAFILADGRETDLLFYMWGHGYEMDYGNDFCSYRHLEQIFNKVAGKEDITFVTNIEAFLRIGKTYAQGR